MRNKLMKNVLKMQAEKRKIPNLKIPVLKQKIEQLSPLDLDSL